MVCLVLQLVLLLSWLDCFTQSETAGTKQSKETLAKTQEQKRFIVPTTQRAKAPPKTKTKSPRPTTKKTIPSSKKSTKAPTEAPVKEFPLDEILFKGRQTNEANAFIKANEQRGKTLETTYESAREQDLNDLEILLRRRNRRLKF